MTHFETLRPELDENEIDLEHLCWNRHPDISEIIEKACNGDINKLKQLSPRGLSLNSFAIPLLLKYEFLIDWISLEANKNRDVVFEAYERKPTCANWRNVGFTSDENYVPIADDTYPYEEPKSLSATLDELFEMDLNDIDPCDVSQNPNAIPFLEKFPEKINWFALSVNRRAISLLEKFPENICWSSISRNSAAIHILLANLDKVCKKELSSNPAIFM